MNVVSCVFISLFDVFNHSRSPLHFSRVLFLLTPFDKNLSQGPCQGNSTVTSTLEFLFFPGIPFLGPFKGLPSLSFLFPGLHH